MEIERATLALFVPAASEAGEKAEDAFVGNPEIENATAPPRVPFEGTTASVKLAGCPASTLKAEFATLTVKSATVSVSADVVPPLGAGLFTVIFKAPLVAKSLAMSSAMSEVGLTKVVERGEPFT